MKIVSLMPYLERNKVKAYRILSGEVNPLGELTIKYTFETKTPNDLVKFIWLVHERKNLKPQLPFGAYVNHIKGLLKELTEDEIILLILKAGEICNHPFTVKFLRGLHERKNE